MNVIEEDLAVDNGIDSWMSNNEFLCKHRVTRDQLDKITNIIADDPIFCRPNRGFPQMPVKHQLMIWLHFVGHEGQSNATQWSRGMCEKARKRIVIAINRIRNDFIHWPDAEERKEITRRIEQEFHIPNHPLMQDGTLLHLGVEPEYGHAADYHGRKFFSIPLR